VPRISDKKKSAKWWKMWSRVQYLWIRRCEMKIYVDTLNCERDVVTRLAERLEKEEIQVVMADVLECILKEQKVSPNTRVLLLTGLQTSLDWAIKNDIPSVGYERQGDGREHLYHADMIVWSLDDLDGLFFQRVYERHFGLPWEIARTEHLILRESTMEDFDELYDLYQESGMADYMPGMEKEKEEERAEFQAYIQNMYPFYVYGMWSVIEKKSGKLVGRAGIENGSFGENTVLTVGYMIGHAYRGKGYGLETVRAVVNYAGEELEAEKLYASIHKDNLPSIRLIKRAGFVRAEDASCISDVNRLEWFVAGLQSRTGGNDGNHQR
jgi:RimJ/RimL family protein N-acetyltransferase